MKIPDILYEDNHLLVVCKPENMPAQADDSGDMDLLTLCKAYVKEKYQKPGEVYLGLVHRLDRPVGGVIVLARTSKAAARLSEQLRTKEARREYRAIVRGETVEQAILQDSLIKEERTNMSRVVPAGTSGAKEASLEYDKLSSAEGFSLLSVRLHTGRSHQIRVQLSHSGHPIWGDARYGGGAPGEQIALFACSLRITHPTLKKDMTFSAKMPNKYPWNLFIMQDN